MFIGSYVLVYQVLSFTLRIPFLVTSGIPLQLDRLLLVILFDHISRRPVRGHLWLWPVPHQMGSYCQGKFFQVNIYH